MDEVMIKSSCFCVREGTFRMLRPIPVQIICDVAGYFAEDLTKERIVQLWYDNDNGYKVVKPSAEEATSISISYRFPLNVSGEYVCTIHSHRTMNAFFSEVDDADELAIPGLYGVIGNISDNEDSISFSSRFRFTRGEGQKPIRLKLIDIVEI